MFPLHLLLSPHSTLPETPAFPAKSLSQPAITRVSALAPERTAMPQQRRAAWALTWLPPETVIVPSTGMNVPEMGR